MGAVWLARDERLDRAVALKQAHPAADERRLRQLSREARIARGIDHPRPRTADPCGLMDPAEFRRLGSRSANVALIGVMLGLFGAGDTVAGLVALVLELMAFVAWVSKAQGMSPKSRASVSDFPPVRERLDEGWLFGEKPPGV